MQMLRKIISGGQTGVDRAALDAALEDGLETGGWCPLGRRAEDGEISREYQLVEAESASYSWRTKLNVRDSDATLVLNMGAVDGGTAETVEHAERMGKPCKIVDLDEPADISSVTAWLSHHNVEVLNVAGPRESRRTGIYREALHFMKRVIKQYKTGQWIAS
jgi:hypothetical protein